MTIPLVVCIVGFIIWFVNSRRKVPDSVIGEAGRWGFILGLAFTLAALIGVKPFE